MQCNIDFNSFFVHCTIFLALDGLAVPKAMAVMVSSLTGPADRARRGLLIVLSSPSGAGKSTISRRLMEEDPSITMSISATTRPMRPGEAADVDYHFVDDAEFQRLVDADELAEWAYVFGYRYGSPKEPIKEALKDGRDTLFDIDWQGTQQLEYAFRTDLVRIFILPPSMAELKRRLKDRGTDEDEVIQFRMHRAAAEIGHWAEYDYVLINEDVDKCTEAVRAIVLAERLRRERQPYLLDFVRELVEKPN